MENETTETRAKTTDPKKMEKFFWKNNYAKRA